MIPLLLLPIAVVLNEIEEAYRIFENKLDGVIKVAIVCQTERLNNNMPVIEISSLSHPGVEMFCTLTEAQLRNRIEPDKGIFYRRKPKGYHEGSDAGYEPLAILCEHKHITGDASDIIERCGNVPVYTGERELLATLTGYVLTRGVSLRHASS